MRGIFPSVLEFQLRQQSWEWWVMVPHVYTVPEAMVDGSPTELANIILQTLGHGVNSTVILERFIWRKCIGIEDVILQGGREGGVCSFNPNAENGRHHTQIIIVIIIIIHFKCLPCSWLIQSSHVLDWLSSQLYQVDFIIFPILKLSKLTPLDVKWCLLVT